MKRLLAWWRSVGLDVKVVLFLLALAAANLLLGIAFPDGLWPLFAGQGAAFVFAQDTQPEAPDLADHRHPAQIQADADVAPPTWWKPAAVAVLALVVALSAVFANGVTS